MRTISARWRFAVLVVLLLAVAGCKPEAEVENVSYIEPHVTNVLCSSDTGCPEGMQCALLPGKSSALCVDKGECGWACRKGENCKSIPGKIKGIECLVSLEKPGEAMSKNSENAVEKETFEKSAGKSAKAMDKLGSVGGDQGLVQQEEVSVKQEEGKYAVHVGESIEINNHKFSVLSISNNPLMAEYTVDARKGKIAETKYWEILGGLKVKLLSFELHGYNSPDTFGVFEIEPFELEHEEYLVEKKYPVSVLGATIKLEKTNSDGWAYISIPEKGVSWEALRPGGTKTFDNLKITLIESFYKTRQYAILKITSVAS